VLLQFEDFNQTNALPLLNRYRNDICCFNDDIQGTAAVTVGTLLAACRLQNIPLSQQRVVFAGAGSAGCGIAEQIVSQMRAEGISEIQARSQVFMVDRDGLLVSTMPTILDFQLPLSKDLEQFEDWVYTDDYPSLLDTVRNAKPTILIGVSGQAGLFTQVIVETLLAECDVPIILPLSNPSKQIEATPEQLIHWSKGQAIVATGSPFSPVEYNGRTIIIPQCNNSYIFPGFGLAVVAAKIRRISDEMLVVASEVLANASPASLDKTASLLPRLSDIGQLSKDIAFAVGRVAFEQGLAEPMSDDVLKASIETQFWMPAYRDYRKSHHN
jgi:malate dehydrogenase (oxaloacetate-decarboxylating)